MQFFLGILLSLILSLNFPAHSIHFPKTDEGKQEIDITLNPIQTSLEIPSFNQLSSKQIIQQELDFLNELEPISEDQHAALVRALKIYIWSMGYEENQAQSIWRQFDNDLSNYEQKVFYRYLFDASKIKEQHDWAERESRLYCGIQKSGTAGDAIRHVIGSAILSYEFGEKISQEITTAHEKKYELLSKKNWESEGFSDSYMTEGEIKLIDGKPYVANWTTRESQMDLYNNYVGRSIGKEISQKSLEWAKDYFIHRALNLLEDGRLMVIRQAPKKCYNYKYYSKDHQQSLKTHWVHFSLRKTREVISLLDNYNFFVVGNGIDLERVTK